MREIAAGAGLKPAGVLAKRAQNTYFWTTRAAPALLAKATQKAVRVHVVMMRFHSP